MCDAFVSHHCLPCFCLFYSRIIISYALHCTWMMEDVVWPASVIDDADSHTLLLVPFLCPSVTFTPPSLYLPMDSILSLTPALHKSPLSTEETMVCALCLTVVNLLVHCFSSQFALQFAPMHWGVDLTSTARACPDWSLPGSSSDWLSKV